jgi:hypothetical protein
LHLDGLLPKSPFTLRQAQGERYPLKTSAFSVRAEPVEAQNRFGQQPVEYRLIKDREHDTRCGPGDLDPRIPRLAEVDPARRRYKGLAEGEGNESLIFYPEVDFMNAYAIIRRSHCFVCGRRLSVKNLFGDIQWQPSKVNDDGLYCVVCYKGAKKDKAWKDLRT